MTRPEPRWPPAITGSCHHVSTGAPPYSCARRSAARAPLGRRSNHSSDPEESRIIGPYCPGPAYGASNRSPGACAPEFSVTVTVGGTRSGREWKCWYSPGLAGGGGAGGVSSERLTVSTTAVVKRQENGFSVAPWRSVAWTVTRSPCANGTLGTNCLLYTSDAADE